MYAFADNGEYITLTIDGTRSIDIKKKYIKTRVSGDYLTISWHDKERRGNTYERTIDYNDVTAPVVVSAGDLQTQLNGWITSGGGSGDVVGPASAVDSNFASFDGGTGKLIKDSGYAPADFQPILEVVAVTGDDTLALTHAWKALVIDDAGGGVEITVPDNATVAFPIGTEIRLLAATTESIDIIADTGVTINSINGWLSLEDQFAEATLVKTATDEWYLYGDLRKTMDSDLAALLAANGVTLTEAQIGYLNDFYIGLKADNIYTKITAMWFGFLGTTLDHKKYNGVDPQNTDAAFRLTFTGSPTPAANHIAYNGTTQYANTHIIPTTHLTENDTHVCIVTSNEYNAGIAIGADNGWPKRFALWPRNGGTRYAQFYDFGSAVSGAAASSIGRHIDTRTASNVHKLFENGVQWGSTNTTATTSWASAIYKLYIGAAGGASPGNYCACNVNYASVGAGLSDADVANYDARLATLLSNFGL